MFRKLCVSSGFRLEVDTMCALLRNYEAYSGDYLPTFREDFSVPSSMVKDFLPFKMGSIGCSLYAA